MRRWVFALLILGLLQGLDTSAQQTVTLHGIITSEITGSALRGVNVKVLGTSGGGSSDTSGRYSFSFSLKDSIVIQFTHVSHETETYVVRKEMLRTTNGNTLSYDLEMAERIFTLNTFDISNTYRPDTVFGSPKISVADFEFYDKEHFVLLTYEKNINRGTKILLTDREQNIVSTHLVPKGHVAIELFKDYEGRINLVCQRIVYLVEVEFNELVLTPIKTNQFKNEIKPIIDTATNTVYISNQVKEFPAFNYFSWTKGDTTAKQLTFVVDKFMMELLRSEWKYLNGRQKVEALYLADEMKVDKEIAASIISGFAHSLYYKPVYAPLFVVDDTVIIFNHNTEQLVRYDGDNTPVDSAKIDYHKTKRRLDWQKHMVQDEITEKIYARIKINGYNYLREIDPHTGLVLRTFKFTWKYTERIRVRNGYVYYVYRPYESMQKKFLYKEKIRDRS